MTIPDEAVEAAARALHALTSHFDGKCDIQEHWTAWVDDARAALTAAAPHIAAQALNAHDCGVQAERAYRRALRAESENRVLLAGIEALRDEWRDSEDEVYAPGRYDLCKAHADALDALNAGGDTDE